MSLLNTLVSLKTTTTNLNTRITGFDFDFIIFHLFQVVLVVSVYAVVARPAETPESVDARQGYNNQGQVSGFPGGFPALPNVGPGSFPASNNPIAIPDPIGSVGSFPSVPVAAPGSYPAGSNSRPAYGYDNAFPDQVNFSGADPNRNVAASVSTPIHNQVTGLIPTNLSGISANAFSSVLSNFKV